MVRVFPYVLLSAGETLVGKVFVNAFLDEYDQTPWHEPIESTGLLWLLFKNTPAEFLVLTLLQGEAVTRPVVGKGRTECRSQ